MRIRLAALFVALLGAVTVFGENPSAADAQLNSLFRRYLDERFALHPTEATELGDHRFDDRTDDLSPAAIWYPLASIKSRTSRNARKETRLNLASLK